MHVHVCAHACHAYRHAINQLRAGHRVNNKLSMQPGHSHWAVSSGSAPEWMLRSVSQSASQRASQSVSLRVLWDCETHIHTAPTAALHIQHGAQAHRGLMMPFSAQWHHLLPAEIRVVVAPEMPVSSSLLVALVATTPQVQPLRG